jgi:uncharacterized protein DUF1259
VNGPVYKITVGRPDLRVVAMDTEITSARGLNSWAAFAGDRSRAHIAGDMAMLEPVRWRHWRGASARLWTRWESTGGRTG